MSEERIAALLKKAEPLRALDDEHPDKVELATIVDQINVLRNPPPKSIYTPDLDPDAPVVDVDPVMPKRRPGRPRNPA